jgi:hypothetical protein
VLTCMCTQAQIIAPRPPPVTEKEALLAIVDSTSVICCILLVTEANLKTTLLDTARRKHLALYDVFCD